MTLLMNVGTSDEGGSIVVLCNVCNLDGNVIFKTRLLFLINLYWQCCTKTVGSNFELGNILNIC
jgi:hypothetical protein